MAASSSRPLRKETTKRCRFKRRRCVSSLCSLFSYGRGSNVERMTLREGNLVGSPAMIDGEELAHPIASSWNEPPITGEAAGSGEKLGWCLKRP